VHEKGAELEASAVMELRLTRLISFIPLSITSHRVVRRLKGKG
jgi:hypothetical protein